MSGTWIVLSALVLASIAFAAAGFAYARPRRAGLEDHIAVRGQMGTGLGMATLLASGLGAWVLFAPAEAATWGGIAVVFGYAVGAAAPRFLFIALGPRMRRVMPLGHGLTEYVQRRYGGATHALVTLIVVFYLFIFLAAEITGMARIVALIADVPLWATATVVMVATLAYTAYGGLRTSIFTDVVQLALIVPLLVAFLAVGWWAVGGGEHIVARLQERAPELLDWTNEAGWRVGLTLVVAILVTSPFHQGYWQRVYAARDDRALRNGFLLSAIAIAPPIFALGLFGLAFVALDLPGNASAAVFAVLLDAIPGWLGPLALLLGLALVMSSVDTVLNALASVAVLEVRRARPAVEAARLRTWSNVFICLPAIGAVVIASQGFSVLYLFLLADLLCAAAVFPVFFGLYSRRCNGRTAFLAILAGLIAGALFFPDPGLTRGDLLTAFLAAALVPVLVTLLLQPRRATFDFADLAGARKSADGPV